MHEAVEYIEQRIISQLQAQPYIYVHSHPMIQVQNTDVTIILCKPKLKSNLPPSVLTVLQFLFYGAVLTIGLTIAMHYDISNCIWAGDNWKLAGEEIKMQVSPTQCRWLGRPFRWL